MKRYVREIMKEITIKYLFFLWILCLNFSSAAQSPYPTIASTVVDSTQIPIPFDATKKDKINVVFWNVENLFDYFDNKENSSDSEFSSFGAKHWTKSRFYTKCNAIGKVLIKIKEQYQQMPAVVGFAEIENRWVLKKIVESDVLKKFDYGIIHFDSHDKRGIDLGLIYLKSVFTPISAHSIPIVTENSDTLATRDILYAQLKHHKGDTIHFLVNHHPSKFSGTKASTNARNTAMQCLAKACDSINTYDSNNICDSIDTYDSNNICDSINTYDSNNICDSISIYDSISVCNSTNMRNSNARYNQASIIIMGDFNDSPSAPQFKILPDTFTNLGVELSTKIPSKSIGSIRFNGKWELIDHFIVSNNILNKCKMSIINFDFLLTKDKAHTGFKPLRTYSGPRYLGGISDHCPILLEFVVF